MLVKRSDTKPVALREHLASIEAISSQHTFDKPYVSCGCASDGLEIGSACGTIVVGSWHHPYVNAVEEKTTRGHPASVAASNTACVETMLSKRSWTGGIGSSPMVPAAIVASPHPLATDAGSAAAGPGVFHNDEAKEVEGGGG